MTARLARFAGVLYLVLIVCGVGSEALVRGSLAVPGDPAATAANLVAHEGAFRLSILADVVMALCDVGLGVALLILLAPAGRGLAVAATAFRLVQASVLGLNLVFLLAALPLARGVPGVEGSAALSALALDLHGVGYDLGLFFFACNCVLVGWLVIRSGFPRVFGVGLVGAGVVYGVGSCLVVLAPELAEGFAGAYALPLVAELGFALFLLGRGPAVVSTRFARGPGLKLP